MTVQNNMKQNKTNFLSFYRFAEQKQFCTTVMEPANFEMTVQNYIEPFPKQYKTNFFLQKQFCATVMQPLNIQQFNVSQKHFCTTVMQPANKTFVWEHLAENVQSQQLSKSVFTNFSLISYF